MLKPTIRERLCRRTRKFTGPKLCLRSWRIALSKLDCPALRELLEENRFRLSHSRHMMDLVPFILQDECSRTRSEVQGKYISIIFDGTTRLGEVLVVVLRYIQDWEIHQRLVRVDFLQKSLNVEELAQQIVCYLLHWVSTLAI